MSDNAALVAIIGILFSTFIAVIVSAAMVSIAKSQNTCIEESVNDE